MSFQLNGQVIRPGKSFVDADGNQYPTNWVTVFSQEQKDALGIVWVPDPAPVDTRFYWDHDVPKRLEDELAVDENGDAVLDEDGVQVINYGLKTEWTRKQKEIAASLFAPTDWYIIRKADTGIDVPTEVKQYRDLVRITSGMREDQIKQAATFEAFVALVTNPATVYDEVTQTSVLNPEPHLTVWPESPFKTR